MGFDLKLFRHDFVDGMLYVSVEDLAAQFGQEFPIGLKEADRDNTEKIARVNLNRARRTLEKSGVPVRSAFKKLKIKTDRVRKVVCADVLLAVNLVAAMNSPKSKALLDDLAMGYLLQLQAENANKAIEAVVDEDDENDEQPIPVEEEVYSL